MTVTGYSICDYERPHREHQPYPGWVCYGQGSYCNNCDDIGCMDCRLRYWHEECEWSCPCCEKGEADTWFAEHPDPAVLPEEPTR